MLGKERKAKGTGHKRRVVEVMMYIPILETLELFLQNETIFSEANSKFSDLS